MGLARLSASHRRLIRESAITKEVADARGYRTISKPQTLRKLGFDDRQSSLVPALYIPVWDVFGENTRGQIRPDHPRLDRQSGRPHKYENQTGAGAVLDINPLVLNKVRNHRRPLYITEGIRKGDALASQDHAAIALYSVWNWRGTDESGALTALEDWEQIPFNDERLVYVVFDSDVMTKRSVKLALERLGNFLERKGAQVRYVYLPDHEDGGKQGVDDWFAAGHDLMELHDHAENHVRGLPEVVVNARQLRVVSERVVKTLRDANDPPQMYRWAGTLARVVVDEQNRPMTDPYNVDALRSRLSQVADYYRVGPKGTRMDSFPPKELAADVLALAEWPFPVLEAVVESPTLRPDGSILDRPGYDPVTRQVYIPGPNLQIPPVPAEPSLNDQRKARKLLAELFQDFPFVGAADQANMFALLLTPILRPAITGSTPLALLDAPQAGTGKSLLAQVVAIVTTGHEAAFGGAPDDEGEWRKSITAALKEAPALVVFDNLMGRLASGQLSRALTAPVWDDRILGISQLVHLPVRTTWAATGNNILLGGDLPRRSYEIRLNASQARPYLRDQGEFLHANLTEWVTAMRGELLWSLLVFARSWWAAGCPAGDYPVVGSYESWCHTVGGVLAHQGNHDFLGNLEQMHEAMDTETAEWAPFLAALYEETHSAPQRAGTIADLILGELGTYLRSMLPYELMDAFSHKQRDAFAKVVGHQFGFRNERFLRHGDAEYALVKGTSRGQTTWRVVRQDL